MMSRELKVGVAAPGFRATVVCNEYGAGREVSLADFRGRMLVLYFYPKDDTPGCTAQACGLRDAWGEIKDRAAVFGVSVDPPESYARFIENPSHKIGTGRWWRFGAPARREEGEYPLWIFEQRATPEQRQRSCNSPG